MMNGTMGDDNVFEDEEGEERDSFVQPARGLRGFALVRSLLRIRDVYTGSGSDHFLVSRIRPSFIPDPYPINKRRENKLTFFMQERS
jgi:hypothetical protein